MCFCDLWELLEKREQLMDYQDLSGLQKCIINLDVIYLYVNSVYQTSMTAQKGIILLQTLPTCSQLVPRL